MQQTLSRSEKAAQNAAGLTQQLLTFSKGGAPVKETASIEKIIHDSLELVLSGSDILPIVDLEADLPLVEMDLTQMTQVFTNLILKAKQAMNKSGKITITARRHIQTDSTPFLKQGRYLLVTIRDEGKGIPADLLEKIFTPFFTTKPKGTGLGLSVCYSVIKKHMGHIEVQSVPGQGASFQIHLPATDRKAVSTKCYNPDLIRPQKILLMDDDEIIRDLFVQMLAKIGCEVTVCPDSRQTLEAMQKAQTDRIPFDMVFLDLTVPDDIGGVETLTHLRSLDQDLYAVATSGYSESKVFSDHKGYGFQDILPKPFTLEQLITRINARVSPSP
jgi:CheY-like chemotaxis protein